MSAKISHSLKVSASSSFNFKLDFRNPFLLCCGIYKRFQNVIMAAAAATTIGIWAHPVCCLKKAIYIFLMIIIYNFFIEIIHTDAINEFLTFDCIFIFQLFFKFLNPTHHLI